MTQQVRAQATGPMTLVQLLISPCARRELVPTSFQVTSSLKNKVSRSHQGSVGALVERVLNRTSEQGPTPSQSARLVW